MSDHHEADTLRHNFKSRTEAVRAEREGQNRGAMPLLIERHADSLVLWSAFRRHVGSRWTAQREKDFVAGWDAAREPRPDTDELKVTTLMLVVTGIRDWAAQRMPRQTSADRGPMPDEWIGYRQALEDLGALLREFEARP